MTQCVQHRAAAKACITAVESCRQPPAAAKASCSIATVLCQSLQQSHTIKAKAWASARLRKTGRQLSRAHQVGCQVGKEAAIG